MTTMDAFKPGLYLVADVDACARAGRGVADTALAAVRGGASMVQLRAKGRDLGEVAALAREVIAVLRPFGTPLIVNDLPEAALAAGAAGVHVGRGDAGPIEARKMLGTGAVIGLTVKTMDDVRRASSLPVDYLGLGPVFTSPTKPEAGIPWGLDGLARACAASSLPVVAIGGLGPDSARAAIEAGAASVAVVSAVCGADDPAAAARRLVREFKQLGPDK